MVARFVRDEEVVGSNPATPTQVISPEIRHRPNRHRGLGLRAITERAKDQRHRLGGLIHEYAQVA